jgi:hypothetical protein
MAGMAGLLFLYAASASFAPVWAVLGLLAVWVVLFVLGCRWFTPHPRRVLWVAVAGAVLWFAVAIGGGLAFDWRA